MVNSKDAKRDKFSDTEEILNLAYYLDYLERESQDLEFSFWGLFCTLFGVPDVNFGSKKNLKFENVTFEVSSSKFQSKFTDSDRWRGILKWLEAHQKNQMKKSKRSANPLIQCLKSNQLDGSNT